MRTANTKERILIESLRLFAEKGYEAVGVVEIARAVGMKAPSLYKHYKSKRDIFESILARVSKMDTEQAKDYHMPEESMEKGAECYQNISFETLRAYTRAMLLYWTEEEFSSCFRKLLTLEQYKSQEMGALYQQYISGGPMGYLADVFLSLTGSEDEAQQLALEFYGPIHLLYSLYDGGCGKERVMALLEKHMNNFFDRLDSKQKERVT
ncbi:MAG: helix-turn-helix domain-containing protein [Clostridia bacterium]|nr:helix-turn-helix domain-containing protein [Clostridia bacterium]